VIDTPSASPRLTVPGEKGSIVARRVSGSILPLSAGNRAHAHAIGKKLGRAALVLADMGDSGWAKATPPTRLTAASASELQAVPVGRNQTETSCSKISAKRAST
jgi:hypothetical protein